MKLRALPYAAAALLYRLTLALGLGGTVMFILFAPILFSVLPHEVPNGRHLAGLIVGKTLPFVQLWGVGGGLLLLGLGVALYWRHEQTRLRVARLTCALLITLTAAASLFFITPAMDTLRDDMGVIDTTPLDDPRRVEFNALHKTSSSVHLFGLLAALGLLALPMPLRRTPSAA
jgi:hypothetical protein